MKYKKGDILVNKYKDRWKILAVVDGLYGLSKVNDFEIYGRWYTEEELDEADGTLAEESKESLHPDINQILKTIKEIEDFNKEKWAEVDDLLKAYKNEQ